MPSLGVHESGSRKGWFLYWRGLSSELGWHAGNATRGHYGHIAYCPEHAGPAIIWLAAYSEWRGRRWSAGKEAAKSLSLTLRERWTGVVDADKVAALHSENRQALQRAVDEWKKSNPVPVPPWATNP